MTRVQRAKPRYAGIEVPTSVKDPDLISFIEAVKERLEHFTGDVGDPKQRFVTLRDLELAGVVRVDVKNKYATAKNIADTAVLGNSAAVDEATLNLVSAILAAGVGTADELPSNYQAVSIDPQLKSLRRFNIADLIGVRDNNPSLDSQWRFNGDVAFTNRIAFDEDYGQLGYVIMAQGDEDSELPPVWAPMTDDPGATFGADLVGDPGTALTALRSDAVLKLDPAISPTWTGVHTFAANPLVASATPRMDFLDTDAGTDLGRFALFVSSGAMGWASVTDNLATARVILQAVRDTTAAVTAMAYGNSTDNPPHTFYGNILAQNTVRLKGYTVATLPAGTAGDTAYVTDALAPAYLTPLVGGGTIVAPAFFDGTTWVAH